jgi:single-strand DNA-binding protein
MKNFYNVTGNITHDLELVQTQSGGSILNFSVAVNENFKNKDGEKVEKTHFFNAVAFNGTAEVIAKYFKKGKPIELHGRLQQDTWDDKTTGDKRSAIKLVVDRWEFWGFDKSDDEEETVPKAPFDTKKPTAKKEIAPTKGKGKSSKPTVEDDDEEVNF